jgi:starch synthase
LFDRDQLYVDPVTKRDYPDNDVRFIVFCRAILDAMKRLDWAPDVIHTNDWQTGLVPALLATSYQSDPFFAAVKSVFTIHNVGYQGIFPPETFRKLDLPEELFYPTAPFEFWGKVNFMKAGISFASLVTTVSEQYAEEIQSSNEYGYGLEGVLNNRAGDLYGIVNGVDYDEWSPTKDRLIPATYGLSNLAGKKRNKVELLRRLGLPYRESVPLIGMITRLAAQKGLDLLVAVANDIFALDLQMVILGTGDKVYHDLLTALEKKYPDKLKVLLKYDNEMAHWIEAGADAFLMPSRYEPCGLNQLYSLKYGTLPIVRATGGLADTVVDVGESPGSGTGFAFVDYVPEELVKVIRRAVVLFGDKMQWREVVKNAMRQDFSWKQSAQRYAELYRMAMARPK